MPHISKDQTRPRVGRPARISRQDVAEAALAIGFARVTMAEIGKYLGVSHSSLYRHVKSRDDILLAAADLAIARLTSNLEADHWRIYVEKLAEAGWVLFQSHPGLADFITRMEYAPPSMIRTFSNACKTLETFGFCPEDAALLVDSVMDMTCDASTIRHQLEVTGKGGKTNADRFVHALEAIASDDANLAPHAFFIKKMIRSDPRDWWQKKLDLILDGAEQMPRQRTSDC